MSNSNLQQQNQNDSSTTRSISESTLSVVVQDNDSQMISHSHEHGNDDDGENDNKTSLLNESLSRNNIDIEESSVDLTAAYLAMREAAEQCYLLLDQQRQALQGYEELAEKHQELQQQFAVIKLENQMWRLDLERERWIHRQRQSIAIAVKTKSKPNRTFDRSSICEFITNRLRKKQCLAKAS